MQPGIPIRCRGCQALIVGALNPNTGKVAPVEFEPHDEGNVLLHRRRIDGEVTLCAWTLGPEMADRARAGGVELRHNHFSRCPKAADFRPNPQG